MVPAVNLCYTHTGEVNSGNKNKTWVKKVLKISIISHFIYLFACLFVCLFVALPLPLKWFDLCFFFRRPPSFCYDWRLVFHLPRYDWPSVLMWPTHSAEEAGPSWIRVGHEASLFMWGQNQREQLGVERSHADPGALLLFPVFHPPVSTVCSSGESPLTLFGRLGLRKLVFVVWIQYKVCEGWVI